MKKHLNPAPINMRNREYIPILHGVRWLRVAAGLCEVLLSHMGLCHLMPDFNSWAIAIIAIASLSIIELGKDYIAMLLAHEYRNDRSEYWLIGLAILMAGLFSVSIFLNIGGVSHYQTTTRNVSLMSDIERQLSSQTRQLSSDMSDMKKIREESASNYKSRKHVAALDSAIIAMQMKKTELALSIRDKGMNIYDTETNNRRYFGLFVPLLAFVLIVSKRLLIYKIYSRTDIVPDTQIDTVQHGTTLEPTRHDTTVATHDTTRHTTRHDTIPDPRDIIAVAAEMETRALSDGKLNADIIAFCKAMRSERVMWKDIVLEVNKIYNVSVSERHIQRHIRK